MKCEPCYCELPAHELKYEPITPTEIIDKTFSFLGVDKEKALSKTRKREMVGARQMSMALLCKHTRLSLKLIGELYATRKRKPFDHTTVMYSRKTVSDLCETDAAFKKTFQDLERFIFFN